MSPPSSGRSRREAPGPAAAPTSPATRASQGLPLKEGTEREEAGKENEHVAIDPVRRPAVEQQQQRRAAVETLRHQPPAKESDDQNDEERNREDLEQDHQAIGAADVLPPEGATWYALAKNVHTGLKRWFQPIVLLWTTRSGSPQRHQNGGKERRPRERTRERGPGPPPAAREESRQARTNRSQQE